VTVEPPDAFTLSRYASPIGEILLVTDAAGRLRALDFHDYEPRFRRLLKRHYGDIALVEDAPPPAIERALTDYFRGDLGALDRLEVATGGTRFQRAVWAALREIPAGRTLNYTQLAEAIGAPKAVRAVGLANGANPVGVVVPCHRVIGANGSLTGYGGGLERKRWLLAHEGASARP
jgi:methylated-DNA-[protein]-cysteine S-methyltransferase